MLKSCNDPLRMFRELQTLGELEVHAEGVEALEFDQLEPDECHLSWRLREIIEHHCAAATSEKDVEVCLVAWYQEHHLKHDADAKELEEHKHCADLVVELEHELNH